MNKTSGKKTHKKIASVARQIEKVTGANTNTLLPTEFDKMWYTSIGSVRSIFVVVVFWAVVQRAGAKSPCRKTWLKVFGRFVELIKSEIIDENTRCYFDEIYQIPVLDRRFEVLLTISHITKRRSASKGKRKSRTVSSFEWIYSSLAHDHKKKYMHRIIFVVFFFSFFSFLFSHFWCTEWL